MSLEPEYRYDVYGTIEGGIIRTETDEEFLARILEGVGLSLLSRKSEDGSQTFVIARYEE